MKLPGGGSHFFDGVSRPQFGPGACPCTGCTKLREWYQAREQRREQARTRRRAPFLFQGIDLRVELRRFWKLPALAQGGISLVPTLRVRHGTKRGGVSGRAWCGSNRIVVTINADATTTGVLEVLLHEAVHCSLPRDVHHNEMFVLRLARAAREAWDIVIDSPLDTKAAGWLRAYRVDDRIRVALDAKFAGVAPPVVVEALPELVAPPVDLAARRAALVERRAKHARAMFEKNAKKLRAAAALYKKWRAKVNYYDRVAAIRNRGAS